MKLIILAAGKGTRLLPLTRDIPKTLAQLGNGMTILDTQINYALDTLCFDEIVIITGYKHDSIESSVKKYQNRIRLMLIYNPFYDISGPIISLWTAHYKMIEDDFIIINGDTIYYQNIFEKAKSFDKKTIDLMISKQETYFPDDMKVKLNENGQILKVSKNMHHNEVGGVSSGFLSIKGEENRLKFITLLKNLVEREEYTKQNMCWHDIINELIEREIFILSHEISKECWFEIDTIGDIERFNTHKDRDT